MFQVAARTNLRIFCWSQQGGPDEVFELPVLHRRYVPYFVMLDKYPTSEAYKMRLWYKIVLQGRKPRTLLRRLSDHPMRRSRSK